MKDECAELGAIGGNTIEGCWVEEVMWLCGKFGVDDALGSDFCDRYTTWCSAGG